MEAKKKIKITGFGALESSGRCVHFTNPKREITVARLELVASLLCAQTVEMLHKELGIAKGKIFCYSDSETTLWWLTKPLL